MSGLPPEMIEARLAEIEEYLLSHDSECQGTRITRLVPQPCYVCELRDEAFAVARRVPALQEEHENDLEEIGQLQGRLRHVLANHAALQEEVERLRAGVAEWMADLEKQHAAYESRKVLQLSAERRLAELKAENAALLAERDRLRDQATYMHATLHTISISDGQAGWFVADIAKRALANELLAAALSAPEEGESE